MNEEQQLIEEAAIQMANAGLGYNPFAIEKVIRHYTESFSSSGVLALIPAVQSDYSYSQGLRNARPAPSLRRLSKHAQRAQRQHPTLGRAA